MKAEGEHTTAEAENFDVILVLRSRQREQCGCKEHSLIVGVCNEQ